MTVSEPSHGRARRLLRWSERTWALLLLVGAFAGASAFSAWTHSMAQPPSEGPCTDGLAGWPRSVDPVQGLGTARRLASRKDLAGLVAAGVRVDGSVDAHGSGRVRYVFQSPPGRGPHAGGMTAQQRARACGKQTVRLGPAGLVAGADHPDHGCPSPAPEPLPDPQCGPRELWAMALGKGASGTALARAEYFHSNSGPAWSFRVGRGEVHMVVDASCKRELGPAAARRRSR
ncbi:MAG: hypothetical protein JW940_12865 [Polyangiaceae bacterium]|nr:hypothetical protein [Polyangiaceae bacterium]